MKAIVAIGALLLLAFHASASVIGIDFGSQYIKAVAIKPGMPFFTVLDEAAKRKSLSLVSFDTKQRLLGNAGEALAIKHPHAAFMWTHRLLGKPFGCAVQQQLLDAGYPYTFSPTPRGTIAVEVDGSKYSVEELVAMQLRMIRHNVFVQSGTPITQIVVTVPPYFSQAERQAVYDAAAIADLKVISLINDNSAAAIEYGRERTYSLNETHTACIFNVGASSTTATVVKYSAYPIKNGLVNAPSGQFEVLGNGFDDSLGGSPFDIRLALYLADRFQEQVTKAGFNVDVRTLPRVMARLRGAAQKAKEVLSANQECQVRVESLYEELDFKHLLDRDTFHEISKDLFDRFTPVVMRALDDAKVSAEDVNAFVLVGGGSRIPRVQEILKNATGANDLDQSLNADEAISFGAALFAANNSVSFRVRKFGYIDRLQYPVGVRLTELSGKDGNEPQSKRASVYSKHARVDSQRHIEVPWESDVRVELHYDDKKLPSCTDQKISQYEITGIAEACAEYKKQGTPSVQITFDLKPDGMVHLVAGEVSVTYTEMEPVPAKKSKAKKDGDSSSQDSEPEMRPVNKTLKTPLTIKMKSFGNVHFLDEEGIKASKAVVDALDERDQRVQDLAAARNRLEAHIYETRSKLDEDSVKKYSTSEKIQQILENLDSAELWLEDNFETDQVSLFKDKLAELKALSDDIFFRKREAGRRSAALDDLDAAIASSSKTLKKIRVRMDWIPQDMIQSHEQLLTETKEWLANKTAEHNSMDPVENPKFLASDVEKQKKQLVDRIALLQRFPKPPPKPADTKKKNATESGKAKSSDKSDSCAESSTDSSKEASSESTTDSSEEASAESTAGSTASTEPSDASASESSNEASVESEAPNSSPEATSESESQHSQSSQTFEREEL